ncbi:MAG: hypothetical protein ABSD29_07630 [Verrucomicrobiota bacterium]
MAFRTPTTLPRLGSEVTAHQEHDDGDRDDANKPYNWISGVEHSQDCNRYFANSCTFNPDGKSGAARTAEAEGEATGRAADACSAKVF